MGCNVCKVCKCKCKSYPDAKISCTQSSTDTSTPEEVMKRMRCSIGLIAMFMEYNRCLQTPEKDSFVWCFCGAKVETFPFCCLFFSVLKTLIFQVTRFHVLVMPARCLGKYFRKVWSTLPTKGVWTQIITYSHFAISTESLWVAQIDSDFLWGPKMVALLGEILAGLLKKLNQRRSQVPRPTPRRRLLKSDGESICQRSRKGENSPQNFHIRVFY